MLSKPIEQNSSQEVNKIKHIKMAFIALVCCVVNGERAFETGAVYQVFCLVAVIVFYDLGLPLQVR